MAILKGSCPAVVAQAVPGAGFPASATIASHSRRISMPPRPRIEAPVPITSDRRGFVDVQTASASASARSPMKTDTLIDPMLRNGGTGGHDNRHRRFAALRLVAGF